jgi:membrane-bound lytic murein transglycosylase B
MRFGLIDLQNGAEATEYWLATDNFFAITHYNRSYFYAMSVVELGRAVRLARGV